MSALQGRRAVVTGGTKGTGAAVSDWLRSRGAHVTAVARHRGSGTDYFIAADLASPAGARQVGNEIRELGGLDILVHVAGGSDAPSGGFAASTIKTGPTS